MPFTLAHPAAVLPFARVCRGPYAFSALVVGSMAPDFEYFVALRPYRYLGHTLPGLFLVCLPAGLLVLFVFHAIVKRPLVALLPPALHRRLHATASPGPRVTPMQVFVLGALVVFGAMTHIAWDSFTHANGAMVQRLPVLDRTVVLAGAERPLYKVLQYGSGVGGLAAIACCVALWVRRQQPAADAPPPLAGPVRWSIVGATVLAAAVAAVIVGPASAGHGLPAAEIHDGLVRSVITSISVTAACVLVYSVVHRAGDTRSWGPPSRRR